MFKCSYKTKINCVFTNTHRAAESKTAKVLQMPTLYTQQEETTADKTVENPIYYKSPETVDQDTKLNGNTEVADKNDKSDVQNLNSIDNLLKS